MHHQRKQPFANVPLAYTYFIECGLVEANFFTHALITISLELGYFGMFLLPV